MTPSEVVTKPEEPATPGPSNDPAPDDDPAPEEEADGEEEDGSGDKPKGPTGSGGGAPRICRVVIAA